MAEVDSLLVTYLEGAATSPQGFPKNSANWLSLPGAYPAYQFNLTLPYEPEMIGHPVYHDDKVPLQYIVDKVQRKRRLLDDEPPTSGYTIGTKDTPAKVRRDISEQFPDGKNLCNGRRHNEFGMGVL
ncbi:MAG: hypothetical protein M1836_001752 [Candelina mexicana]|nr:MAG: hypothetical protein M1836_001752 [Candelina mexicana]